MEAQDRIKEIDETMVRLQVERDQLRDQMKSETKLKTAADIAETLIGKYIKFKQNGETCYAYVHDVDRTSSSVKHHVKADIFTMDSITESNDYVAFTKNDVLNLIEGGKILEYTCISQEEYEGEFMNVVKKFLAK